jgi:hypothetical protein
MFLKRSPRVAASCLMVSLVACTGGPEQARAPGATTSSRAKPSVKPSPHFSPGTVTMFVGLDAERGVLAETCERGSCRLLTTPRPKRFLPAAETGLVSFATGAAPKSATMELRRSGRGADTPPAQTIDLTPRTLMATTLTVPSGRYVVTLIGTWPGREARWVFGLQGRSD